MTGGVALVAGLVIFALGNIELALLAIAIPAAVVIATAIIIALI